MTMTTIALTLCIAFLIGLIVRSLIGIVIALMFFRRKR